MDVYIDIMFAQPVSKEIDKVTTKNMNVMLLKSTPEEVVVDGAWDKRGWRHRRFENECRVCAGRHCD